jgi:hypothetical protein
MGDGSQARPWLTGQQGELVRKRGTAPCPTGLICARRPLAFRR